MIEIEQFPYWEYTAWSQDNERKLRWTTSLEAAGADYVRVLVLQPTPSEGGSIWVGGDEITKGFALQWLRWHDNREAAAEGLRQQKTQARLEGLTQWATWATVAAAAAAIFSAVATGIQAYYAMNPPP
jgi:hypothetical protein